VVTLRIFVGRAELYRRDTTLEGLSASIDALASSMRALAGRQCVVAVATAGNLSQVLGRISGQKNGVGDGMA
jgi:hypothetical protein